MRLHSSLGLDACGCVWVGFDARVVNRFVLGLSYEPQPPLELPDLKVLCLFCCLYVERLVSGVERGVERVVVFGRRWEVWHSAEVRVSSRCLPPNI